MVEAPGFVKINQEIAHSWASSTKSSVGLNDLSQIRPGHSSEAIVDHHPLILAPIDLHLMLLLAEKNTGLGMSAERLNQRVNAGEISMMRTPPEAEVMRMLGGILKRRPFVTMTQGA